MAEKKSTSEVFQISDILLPNAELKAFKMEMNDEIVQFFQDIEQQQENVLKLKKVNEDRLRMIVQR